jgi:hypothetical protein
VCENGTVIQCPGLFARELIVMIEHSRKSILTVMNASDPNTEYATSVFNELVQTSFSNCILNYNKHSTVS